MNDTLKGFLLAVAVALLAALGVFFFLVGSAVLQTVALVIGGAVAASAILIASSFPIRAYRRKDATGETHYVHDGTKTIVKETRVIDGRAIEAPKLYQLPSQPGGAFYPELMRAAYQAGALGPRGSGETVDAEARELTPDEWNGDITA